MGKSKELATLTDVGGTIDGALTITETSNQALNLTTTGLGSQVVYQSSTTNTPWYTGVAGSTADDFLIYQGATANAGDIYMYTNSYERMRIDASGRVTMPYQPAFNATAGSSTSLGLYWQKIDYSQQVTQTGGHYNATNYRFTAPVNGWYQFNASWSAENNSDIDGTFALVLNGSVYANFGTVSMSNTGANYEGHVISACAYLYANDYVEVFRYSTVNTTTRGFDWTGNFSGYLIG